MYNEASEKELISYYKQIVLQIEDQNLLKNVFLIQVKFFKTRVIEVKALKSVENSILFELFYQFETKTTDPIVHFEVNNHNILCHFLSLKKKPVEIFDQDAFFIFVATGLLDVFI